MDQFEELVSLFIEEGAREYFGEPVSQATHMLQSALFAERAGASPSLIAAALLHDVGHFNGTASGDDLLRGIDNHHEESGARWLGRWFGPEVTEPVRLHVPAKRYLCAVDPSYATRLSDASVASLATQGGPMSAAEVEAFRSQPFAEDALAVRSYDDEAKDPDLEPPTFEYYLPLLETLADRRDLPG